MNNILEKIIKKKIEKLEEVKKNISLDLLKDKIAQNNSYLNFKEKIFNNVKNNKISIIAEIKKASPSSGIIFNDYEPLKIANIYNDYKVTCLSVLTEEEFFLGSLKHIDLIKKEIKLPVLCKDFFVDPFQIYQAKSHGADAILIILAGINNDNAENLYNEALKLNMSVIVEVHTIDEAKNALKFSEALIGINNRNLKTLEVSINNSISIFEVVKTHRGPIISESGIKNEIDAKYIFEKTGIKNFLIGESLLKSDNPAELIKRFIQINQ